MNKKISTRFIDLLFLMICIVVSAYLVLRIVNGQHTVYKSIYALTVPAEVTYLILSLVLIFIFVGRLTGLPRKFFRREKELEEEDKNDLPEPREERGPRHTPPKRKRKKGR